MRVKHKVMLTVGDDAELKDKLFATDETLAEVVADGFTRVNSGRMHVDATETETVPRGDVTAIKGVFLKANQDCTVKLNGGVEPIALTRSSTLTAATAKLFMEAALTGVAVTAGATAVDLVFCIWGDPAA